MQDFQQLKKNKPALELIKLINSSGHDARFVGGCVRDSILGTNKEVADIDIATNLCPDDVENLLKKNQIKTIDVGKSFGTVIAIIGNNQFEITTLRKDVTTDGRRAVVKYTNSWEEDSNRRDFTINALSYDPINEKLSDYHNGLADLKQGIIRFIGSAQQRILEDHLRIIRYYRFLGKFAKKELKEQTNICKENAFLISKLSGERRLDELKKILSNQNFDITLSKMLSDGIIDYFLAVKTPLEIEKLFSYIAKIKNNNNLLEVILSLIIFTSKSEINKISHELKISNMLKQQINNILKLLNQAQFNTENINEAIYYFGKEVSTSFLTIDSAIVNRNLDEYYIEKEKIEKTNLPKFCIKAADILHMAKHKTDIGKLLKKAENIWVKSGFKYDKNEILTRLSYD